jgi:hypothetical protein
MDVVLPPDQLPYEFIKRESSHALEWLFVQPLSGGAVIAMAN